jgi:hypothetical protein
MRAQASSDSPCGSCCSPPPLYLQPATAAAAVTAAAEAAALAAGRGIMSGVLSGAGSGGSVHSSPRKAPIEALHTAEMRGSAPLEYGAVERRDSPEAVPVAPAAGGYGCAQPTRLPPFPAPGVGLPAVGALSPAAPLAALAQEPLASVAPEPASGSSEQAAGSGAALRALLSADAAPAAAAAAAAAVPRAGVPAAPAARPAPRTTTSVLLARMRPLPGFAGGFAARAWPRAPPSAPSAAPATPAASGVKVEARAEPSLGPEARSGAAPAPPASGQSVPPVELSAPAVTAAPPVVTREGDAPSADVQHKQPQQPKAEPQPLARGPAAVWRRAAPAGVGRAQGRLRGGAALLAEALDGWRRRRAPGLGKSAEGLLRWDVLEEVARRWAFLWGVCPTLGADARPFGGREHGRGWKDVCGG